MCQRLGRRALSRRKVFHEDCEAELAPTGASRWDQRAVVESAVADPETPMEASSQMLGGLAERSSRVS